MTFRSVPLHIALAEEVGCTAIHIGHQVVPDCHCVGCAQVERQPTKPGAARPKADAPVAQPHRHHGR